MTLVAVVVLVTLVATELDRYPAWVAVVVLAGVVALAFIIR